VWVCVVSVSVADQVERLLRVELGWRCAACRQALLDIDIRRTLSYKIP
jgi:hypothetical protein